MLKRWVTRAAWVAGVAAWLLAMPALASPELEKCKAAVEKAGGVLARIVYDYEAAKGDAKKQAELREKFAHVAASVAMDKLPAVTDPAEQKELEKFIAAMLRPVFQRWDKIAAARPEAAKADSAKADNAKGDNSKADAGKSDKPGANDNGPCFAGATLVTTPSETYCVTADHKKHGIWTHFYAPGKKKAESTYRNGKRDGPRRLWSADGKLREEEFYADDEPDGVWSKWNDAGVKVEEIRYRKGKRHGECKWFTDDGKPKQTTEFAEGRRHGVAKRWHNNGALAEEAHYKDGKAEGPKTEWSPLGAVVAASCWHDDKEIWHTADASKLNERPCK